MIGFCGSKSWFEALIASIYTFSAAGGAPLGGLFTLDSPGFWLDDFL